MKKKLRLFAAIGCVFIFGIIIGGCRMPDIVSGSLSSKETVYDLESYKLMGGNRGGLGQSMVQEYDSDGNPKLYSGDIQELIKKYEKQK